MIDSTITAEVIRSMLKERSAALDVTELGNNSFSVHIPDYRSPDEVTILNLVVRADDTVTISDFGQTAFRVEQGTLVKLKSTLECIGAPLQIHSDGSLKAEAPDLDIGINELLSAAAFLVSLDYVRNTIDCSTPAKRHLAPSVKSQMSEAVSSKIKGRLDARHERFVRQNQHITTKYGESTMPLAIQAASNNPRMIVSFIPFAPAQARAHAEKSTSLLFDVVQGLDSIKYILTKDANPEDLERVSGRYDRENVTTLAWDDSDIVVNEAVDFASSI